MRDPEEVIPPSRHQLIHSSPLFLASMFLSVGSRHTASPVPKTNGQTISSSWDQLQQQSLSNICLVSAPLMISLEQTHIQTESKWSTQMKGHNRSPKCGRQWHSWWLLFSWAVRRKQWIGIRDLISSSHFTLAKCVHWLICLCAVISVSQSLQWRSWPRFQRPLWLRSTPAMACGSRWTRCLCPCHLCQRARWSSCQQREIQIQLVSY